ncbi:MAG: uncharacterized protein QG567_1072 [Campylobacterota bacterium]|nr:uncharacterized protein [Campylobacterota bacterium]
MPSKLIKVVTLAKPQNFTKKPAKGCVAVGLMYDNGKGVKQNRSRAKELFGKACDMKLQAGCDEYKLLNVQGY